ncbi:GDSL-like Lipase/Acylhydrolase [Stieleria neptunia]|uniref:GDSL-like Lipase/Acylhydrolase n=1 Tax=Stieleria neptunia TaxID=2527979 RepID=A0A518HVI6_9BACT|nr:SGNH/GDSL hydrolase family protein [Stieleria neptunia]QDV44866.1 GDSL-like Lipase/Acylhydrolase [Stieleria neptunia]
MVKKKSPSQSKQPPPEPPQPRRTISAGRKVILSVVVVASFFVVVEALLRVAGYRVPVGVERMEFTFPIDDYNTNSPQPFLARDETLFWRPRPGALGHNSMGFYGPDFSADKQDGVFRIVCLGDSCTHFGPITYPDMLRAYLDKVAPGKFEVINAGVIGYTSFQGKRLLETEAIQWDPDLVTVYFGWNDHWLARGFQDKDQQSGESTVADGLGNARLFQLIQSFVQRHPAAASGMRVEPEDYRANLSAISATCQANGIRCWYLTAPHAFDIGVPPYLVESGEAKNLEDLLEIHRSYNQIVRDVADARGDTLIDLEKEIDPMNKLELFIDDHIHLSQQGRLLVAKRMADELRASGVLQVDADQ